MNNQISKKEELKEKAILHNNMVELFHMKEIKNCIKNTEKIEYENKTFPKLKKRPPMLIVNDMATVDAVYEYTKRHKENIAVLNFASYKYPGGGYMNGSFAQEESICHSSILFQVLSHFSEWYSENLITLNKGLYSSRGLYSKDILFTRPILDGEWNTKCDVITIASPNKYDKTVSKKENSEALDERIRFVLESAASHNVKTLILGAYGCGVFNQDSKEVASIFKKYLITYDYGFERVVFSIIANTKTENFVNFLKGIEGKTVRNISKRIINKKKCYLCMNVLQSKEGKIIGCSKEKCKYIEIPNTFVPM